MLYFAITLVMIGILCLIYVSLNTGSSNKTEPQKHREYPTLKESLFNAKYPEFKTDLYDERIRNERQHFYQESPETKPLPEAPVPKEEKDLQRQKSFLVKEPERPELIESTEILSNEVESAKIEIEFNLEGTLYLDRGRKIPLADIKLKERPLVDEFAGFSRMGHGLMTEDKGIFYFHAGNAVYSYAVNDLEQIVFYNQGFALIPLNKNLPAPLFLTDAVDEMKEFLSHKKHNS